MNVSLTGQANFRFGRMDVHVHFPFFNGQMQRTDRLQATREELAKTDDNPMREHLRLNPSSVQEQKELMPITHGFVGAGQKALNFDRPFLVVE